MANVKRNLSRRGLLGAPLAVSAALSFDHRPLLARMRGDWAPPADAPSGPPPVGTLGKLRVSRLIYGGNLFSGFAHSGDLVYLSTVLKQYFSEEKILETLQIAEAAGVNSAILRTDNHIVNVLKRYRKERGGRIQWIAQTYPTAADPRTNIQMAIDNGAVGAFIMGGNAGRLCAEGRLDAVGEALALMKRNGLVSGVGAHTLSVLNSVEGASLDFDFYFKTVNGVGYESEKPAEVAAYMKSRKKPWIAFKVLGAGRMPAREGFDLAFRSGADFINVGMYDFQIKDDTGLTRTVVAAHATRDRPWAG